jgi:hypothetical protein
MVVFGERREWLFLSLDEFTELCVLWKRSLQRG